MNAGEGSLYDGITIKVSITILNDANLPFEVYIDKKIYHLNVDQEYLGEYEEKLEAEAKAAAEAAEKEANGEKPEGEKPEGEAAAAEGDGMDEAKPAENAEGEKKEKQYRLIT